MDKDSVDRIRSATFPLARKGYEKREVERFLNELADWLETGGGDEARSDLVRQELARIGQETSNILTEAHDLAERIREEARREVRQRLTEANLKAESLQASAEDDTQEARDDADAYARKIRADAAAYAEGVRLEAETQATQTRSEAAAEAKRIVEDAKRRRADVEAVISDLEQRRDAVLGELERLATDVAGAATLHRETKPLPLNAPTSPPAGAPAAKADGDRS